MPGRRRVREFLARILSPAESREYATNVPPSWYDQHPIGGPRADVPYASGIGFVSSPFSSYYEKAWGVLPTADQARYRIIYRTVPVAHAAVDKLVESATAKGFSLDVNEDNPAHDAVLDACNDWLTAHPEFPGVMQAAAKDLLVHGIAYVEPCFAETGFDTVSIDAQEQARFNGTRKEALGTEARARFDRLLPDLADMREEGVFTKFSRYHDAFLSGIGPGTKHAAKVPRGLYENPITFEDNPDKNIVLLTRGTRVNDDGAETASPLVWLKNLDPLTMRPRRDAWGNIFGAIQYLVVPPVAFDTGKIVMGTWNPTSTFYESAFGVSLFQSLIRTQEAIWQIENDLLIIGHALAKPPHQFTRGLIDKETGRPFSVPGDADWTAFQTQMAARAAGSDLFTMANIGVQPINQQLQSSMGSIIAYLQYHHQQRIIALKVPPQLLGVPEGSTRTTAEVSQGDYVLTVQSLQGALGRMMCQVFEAVIRPLEAALGDNFEVPAIKWNPITEMDETIELSKVVQAFDAGLITLDEARRTIANRGIFEIPEDGEEGYDEALAELEEANKPEPFLMPGQASSPPVAEREEAPPKAEAKAGKRQRKVEATKTAEVKAGRGRVANGKG